MKIKVVLGLLLVLGTVNTVADTLKDVVENVLDTNPIVNERMKNYRAVEAEIGVAEAGYYPTVNIESAVGRKTTGRIDNDIANETYSVFQNALILRQNIFNGFSTNESVNYQKMRTLAAAYTYLEKANDVTLQAVNVYVNLQKESELLHNSQLNVEHNEITYQKVKKAYDAGLSTLSEVSRIHASMSLAKSNMMLQQNRLANAHNNFKRVVGRDMELEALEKVHFDLKLPQNQDKAQQYALEYNPSILAGNYNVKGAEALYRESKSAFYPKVNVVLSQNYNENYNEYIGTDDRSQGLLVASYNLYNGGADEAKKLNSMHKLHQEVSVVDNLKREVGENVSLAWSSYVLSLEQIPFLEEYKNQSDETLKLYVSEYKLGKRSMPDLISAENDLKRANDELISSKYNLILSKYRVMHAMGLTMVSIVGSEQTYYERVGLHADMKHQSVGKTLSYDDLNKAMRADDAQQEQNEMPVPKKVSKNMLKDVPAVKQNDADTDKKQDTINTVITELTKVRWESR